ncbi:GTP-binding domain protein [Citrifermentans bemidjiense Bem]|uniref:GTP-binding domain protein n=1 Tax=Citrifermentans bemidjiense (strain ATCC BAA-1014 / DSM 16622 / JCM 12645 / Bem) TaxID=404380 RepID=B5EF18_CITBB|nr:GTPase domain-containing protein [Citrifermentans bemidjiense]ACH39327.1 GTP-binding domain protein [Citrifermentans bemidjiense Bem]
MALVNQAKREINAKIVFFGPAQAGKATSLKHVFNKLKPEFRGAMKVMNVQDARMLFFDFTPPGEGNVDGYKVRFHLYTVSGSNVDPAAWKMVLKGVDGVVFVADSAPQQQEQNRRSMDDLVAFLQSYGQSLVSVPTVLQLNKSDLPDAAAVADLERSLNPSRLPSFRASSQNGEGVLQALMSLVKTVLTGLKSSGAEGITGSEGLQRVVEEPVASSAAKPQPPTTAPQPSQARATEPPAGAGEEEPLSLELSGAPTAAGGDVISVPLTIRSGSRSKQVVLTLSLAVEKG